jgi:hypothetical protein
MPVKGLTANGESGSVDAGVVFTVLTVVVAVVVTVVVEFGADVSAGLLPHAPAIRAIEAIAKESEIDLIIFIFFISVS